MGFGMTVSFWVLLFISTWCGNSQNHIATLLSNSKSVFAEATTAGEGSAAETYRLFLPHQAAFDRLISGGPQHNELDSSHLDGVFQFPQFWPDANSLGKSTELEKGLTGRSWVAEDDNQFQFENIFPSGNAAGVVVVVEVSGVGGELKRKKLQHYDVEERGERPDRSDGRSHPLPAAAVEEQVFDAVGLQSNAFDSSGGDKSREAANDGKIGETFQSERETHTAPNNKRTEQGVEDVVGGSDHLSLPSSNNSTYSSSASQQLHQDSKTANIEQRSVVDSEGGEDASRRGNAVNQVVGTTWIIHESLSVRRRDEEVDGNAHDSPRLRQQTWKREDPVEGKLESVEYSEDDSRSAEEETEEPDRGVTGDRGEIRGEAFVGQEGECNSDSGGTCRVLSCYSWRGPTECTNGKCTCVGGYCSDGHGVCRGCAHLSVEIHEVPMQADKSGYYSAVHGFFVAGRAVWKQFHGRNWLWYCRTHSCWVMSDLAPNDVTCDAGVVSPLSTSTVTPFDVSGAWKVWDGYRWIDDQEGNSPIRIRCQDTDTVGVQSFFSEVPKGRNSGTEAVMLAA